MTTKLTNLIRKFHNDEEGLEALQVVMIIAIAAMVMIACATLGQRQLPGCKANGARCKAQISRLMVLGRPAVRVASAHCHPASRTAVAAALARVRPVSKPKHPEKPKARWPAWLPGFFC